MLIGILGFALFAFGALMVTSNTSSRFGPMILVAGAILLLLRVTGAIAADLPVKPKAEVTHAPKMDARAKRAQKKFEDMLLSPIGEGRLE